MERDEIKQKILLAAIDCIEESGMDRVTMRKIAKKAEINSAMLNYYFGSKQNLIDTVVQVTIDEGLSNNLNDYHDQWDNNTRAALCSFLYDTLTGMLKYPNITKSHFYEVMVNNNYECVSITSLKKFLDELFGLVKGIIAGMSDTEKRVAFLQLFSAVIMMGLMPGLYSDNFHIELEDNDERENIIMDLVKRYTASDT